MGLVDVLFGRPLASDEEQGQRITPAQGIPMFGLDALSSAAYGPGSGVNHSLTSRPCGCPVRRSVDCRDHRTASAWARPYKPWTPPPMPGVLRGRRPAKLKPLSAKTLETAALRVLLD